MDSNKDDISCSFYTLYSAGDPFIQGLVYPIKKVYTIWTSIPTVILSDLHLGTKGPGDLFSSLYEREGINVVGCLPSFRHNLVIAGDFIDMWRFPGQLEEICSSYSEFIRLLFTRPSVASVVIIKGNHDSLLKASDLVQYLSPRNVVLCDGLKIHNILTGEYLFVTHGHQKDPMIKLCGSVVSSPIGSLIRTVNICRDIACSKKADRNKQPVPCDNWRSQAFHSSGDRTTSANDEADRGKSNSNGDLFKVGDSFATGRTIFTMSLAVEIRNRFQSEGCRGVIFGHLHTSRPTVYHGQSWLIGNSSCCLKQMQYIVVHPDLSIQTSTDLRGW